MFVYSGISYIQAEPIKYYSFHIKILSGYLYLLMEGNNITNNLKKELLSQSLFNPIFLDSLERITTKNLIRARF